MSLPELLRRQAVQLLDKFCRERVPCQRYQGIRLTYELSRNQITLFEEWQDPPESESWRRVAMARFSFIPELNQWALFSIDQERRWQFCPQIPPSLNLAQLLQALDEDPTGTFWIGPDL